MEVFLLGKSKNITKSIFLLNIWQQQSMLD